MFDILGRLAILSIFNRGSNICQASGWTADEEQETSEVTIGSEEVGNLKSQDGSLMKI